MAVAYSTTVRNNRLTQIANAVDGGTGAGILTIYDGTRPATGGTATNALSQHTMSDPAFGTPSSGSMTANAIGSATASATGTATWARITDSAGTFVCDMDVGATGSGAELELDSTSITSGQTVNINSLVINEGNA